MKPFLSILLCLIILTGTSPAAHAQEEEDIPKTEVKYMVSLSFKDIPAEQAIKLIEDDTGVTITVSPELKDKLKQFVSLEIKNIPVLQAVLIISSQIGGKAEMSGNVISIIPIIPAKFDPKGVIITVNSTPITESDISVRISRYYPDSPPPAQKAAYIKKQIAFQLISEHLQNAFIEKNLSKVKVLKDRVEKQLKDHTTYASESKDSKGKKLFKDLKSYYERYGCADEQSFIETVLIPGIKYHLFFEHQVTEEKLDAFYKRYSKSMGLEGRVKARHILFKTDGTPQSDALAKKKAEETLKKLKEGADFSVLAKEVSQCPSKENGGDLGFFNKGQMVKPFEEAAFSLKINELSNPVKTEFGWHIIQITEKTGAQTLEEARDTVTGHYIQMLRSNHANQLIQEADIKILKDFYSDILKKHTR